MANLTFPTNPTNGQKYTFNGKVFEYSSSTGRWSATRAQLLGSLPDDVTIDAPQLSLSNNTIALDTVGQNVSITYTVDQDAETTLTTNGIEDSTATVHKSNNTITITAGSSPFSSANVIVSASNRRKVSTASISLSSTVPWSLDVTSFSLDVTQTISGLDHSGMVFTNNGSYMHLINSSGSYKRYELPTPYDITVMQNEFSTTMDGNSAGETDWIINSSGQYFIISGGVGSDEYFYGFSRTDYTVPFDLRPASRENQVAIATSNFAANMTVNNDGSKIYAMRNATMYEFDLTNPYRLNVESSPLAISHTATLASGTGYAGSNAAAAGQFNENGTELYWMYWDTYWRIKKYTLSTPFDISTLSATSEESGDGDLGSATWPEIYNYKLSPDGTKAYFLNNGSITQYSTS
jgi:hypothetical protein